MLSSKATSPAFLPLITILACSVAPASAADPTDLVRTAIRLPCQAADLESLPAAFPFARSHRSWVRYTRTGIIGRRTVFEVAGGELDLEFSGRPGQPDQVSARYLVGATRLPRVLALADHSCTIHTARQLIYDDQGRPEWLQDLDDRLRPAGAPQPLNPPVPPGADPAGIAVGQIDSGVNYLLPEIATRLARDPHGAILGYDYWDLDGRPFDGDPTPDPFDPARHGTQTASLLLAEAPMVALVPYRYPRNAMTRMPALITAAAAQGIRVMNVSLATANRHQWLPFESAARAHPEMLFVVAAGNFGRNIEQQATYPAALDLDNMIVVTSASADGRLSAGVNWGPRAVDLMAPGEQVRALDFDGVRRPVSGSSYATARISALAACLLAGNPEWSTAELKAAIFREALADATNQVAQGFVPDAALGSRGACASPATGFAAPTRRS
jgi:hypothetical protein